MIEGLAGSATTPPVAATKTAASSPATTDPGKAAEHTAERAPPKAANHSSEPLQGFNPALSIDPRSHIVVMTFSGPDGKVLQQIPNKQQLAAYDAGAGSH